MNLIDANPEYAEELAQAAYIAGDVEKSELLSTIAELLTMAEENEDIVKEHSALIEKTKNFDAYQAFFYECSQNLRLSWPAPSVTNGHDCSIIYDTISKADY